MASEACMLTTFDNPYDPFTQFDKWLLFDMEKGYNSCLLGSNRQNQRRTD